MKKSVRLTIAFLKLIRLPNLLIIFLTLYVSRYAVLKPLLAEYGLQLQLGFYTFMLLSFSVILIAAAGYVINDYFDRKTDIINKPGKVIIGRYIDRRFAMFIHVVFNLFALVFGAYVSFRIQIPELSIAFLMVTGLLWFYSTTYKRQFLVGNLIVSLFAGLVPLMVWLFEIPALKLYYGEILPLLDINHVRIWGWIGGFSIFAFLMNLVRELIKDTEDHEGDLAIGRNTMPVLWGIEITRIVTLSLIAVIVLSVILVNIWFISHVISLLYCLFAIVLPLCSTGYILWLAGDKKDYRQASTWLKVVMVTGICYAFIAYFDVLT